jgi:hypothetical protein
LLSLGNLATAAPAAAFQQPPTEAQWDAITRHAYKGGTSAPITALNECIDVCDDLYLSEHRPMPNQPSSQKLHNQLRRLRTRTKMVPTVGMVLTKMNAVAGGAFLVYTGATFARRKIMGFEPPMELTQNTPAGALTWVERGVVLSSGSMTCCSPEWELTAPEDGIVAGPAQSVNDSHPGFPGDGCTATGAELPMEEFGRFLRLESQIIINHPTCWEQNLVEDASRMEVLFAPHITMGPEGQIPFPPVPYDPGNPNHPVPQDGPGQGGNSLDWWPDQPSTAPQARSRVQAELESKPQDYDVLQPWYEHNFDPENNEDPLIERATVPDCRGVSYTECVDALREAGFSGTITFIEADFQGADVTLLPEQVVNTQPSEGSRVDIETPVEVLVNPPVESMPVVIPSPLPGETWQGYSQRLIDLGLDPYRENLAPELIDPSVGPDGVVRSTPGSGTRVQPGTDVTVRTNPSDAPPAVGGGPGAWAPPSIPAINLSPLHVPIGDKFPFGVPAWLLASLGGWDGGTACPGFSWPFQNEGTELDVDFCEFDPAMAVIRPVLLILSFISLAWLFMGAAMGFGGNQGEE